MWSCSYFSDSFHSVDLIRLVKRQPVLWNPLHANHSYKQVRDKAWESIAEKIVKNWASMPDKEKHGSVAEIKSKWKNIKDTFTKDKKLRNKNGEQIRKKRKYIYSDILQFLNFPENPEESFLEEADETLQEQEETEQNKTVVKPDDLDIQNNSDVDEMLASKSEFIFSDCESGNEQSLPATRNILFVDSTSTEISEEYHDDSISKQSSSSGLVTSSSIGRKRSIDDVSRSEDGDGGDDPDKMFLLSMLPLFKNLNEQNKIVARIQLTQVLQKLLYPKKC